MPDEKNAEELSAQLASINEQLTARGFESFEQFLTDRDAVAQDRDRLKDIDVNAQKLIQRQGVELGELRKLPGAKKPDGGKKEEDGTPSPAAAGDEITIAELRAKIKPDQQAKIEEVYASLPDVSDDPSVLTKDQVANDPAVTKQFLQTALAEVKSIPTKLFDDQPPTTVSVVQDRIRSLFNKQEQQDRFMPAGPLAGPRSGPPSPKQEQKRKPMVVGSAGVLDTAKQAREAVA